MIHRPFYVDRIDEVFESHPICGILGPRQCGKTTLAQYYIQLKKYNPIHYFDLEDPTDLAKLENPKLTLEPLEGMIVLDEIQRRPEIFPYLRVLADRYPSRKILILGSASRDLIQQSSESLAGRISYVELTPFTLSEVEEYDLLWKRGGFPRSYLAASDRASLKWRHGFIKSFLERDIAAIGFDVSPYDMRRLWTMIAHYHGNIVNYSEIGRSLGISDNTTRKYVHLLHETFMVRVLKPWFANIKKRQIKSPKIYIRDSGLLHALLDMDEDHLSLHPKVGASWEGFALEEVIRYHEIDSNKCYFWSTQHRAELDLLIEKKGRLYGYEFKYTDSPKITKSIQIALEDLSLEKVTIIIPGKEKFSLSSKVDVLGIGNFIHLE